MYMSMPTVTQRTLLSTALTGDSTPLGRISLRQKSKGFFRGLGRAGMGLGALGDPLDIGSEISYDPRAEGLAIPPIMTVSTTPGVVTTVTAAPTGVDPSKVSLAPASSGWKAAFAFAGLAGGALGLYHGWNRTHSTPWTVGWGFAGAIFPIVAVPIMLFQGFGKRGGR